MGSLEKIDDNNFVIKMKTDDISYDGSNQVFEHLGYSWTLCCYRPGNRSYFFLKCTGPNNNLWNINAVVTSNFLKSDGTSEVTKTIDTYFNLESDKSTILADATRIIDTFKSVATNVEVHVKINSITRIEQQGSIDIKKEDAELSDVALVVEGKKLYVNKTVLAIFSPVFRTMFFSGFKEATDKEVVINDVKYEDFEQFLQVIYSSHPVINKDNVETLLTLADQYDVKMVVDNCEKYLLITNEVSLANKLRLAETYTMGDVHKKYIDSLDTKEKVEAVCEYNQILGPKTLRVLVKKLLSYS